MAEASESKPDPFRASLLGGICAAAVVLAFLGLHWSLHFAGRVTADVVPLVTTTRLMRPLAGVAIPAGLAIGLGAGLLRRHRVGTLLVAGLVGYVATSVIATVWLKPPLLGEHGLAYWLGQGMWASLTYAVVAGPPLVAALVVLEKITRPADIPATLEAAPELELVERADEANDGDESKDDTDQEPVPEGADTPPTDSERPA